jgi:hypothetical protein
MIIKGKLAFTDDGHLPENVSLDIPDDTLRPLITDVTREIVLSMLTKKARTEIEPMGQDEPLELGEMDDLTGMQSSITIPPPPPPQFPKRHPKPPSLKERCETCRKSCMTPRFHVCSDWEPKSARADSLAKARESEKIFFARYMKGQSNYGIGLAAMQYFKTAITEEQTKTERIKHDLTEAYKKELDDLTRRLEEAETRYGVAEADRNREIERREEAERKLAAAEDMIRSIIDERHITSAEEYVVLSLTVEEYRELSRLAARREERKG